MGRHDHLAYRDPLDLLRRFVPTPLKARYRFGTCQVVVQTNDFALLPALPLETSLAETGGLVLEWKLIRDADSHGPLEAPTILKSQSLTILQMGPPCLVAMDHERRELLGFIGADIDAHTYREFLLPILSRITREAFSAEPLSGSLAWKEETVHD